jgi:hypothetical protein
VGLLALILYRGAVVVGSETALLQLGARLEGLDAPVLALDLGVGARQKERDVRCYLIAEGGLCRG